MSQRSGIHIGFNSKVKSERKTSRSEGDERNRDIKSCFEWSKYINIFPKRMEERLSRGRKKQRRVKKNQFFFGVDVMYPNVGLLSFKSKGPKQAMPMATKDFPF
jgi:hypothetical protein